MIKYNVNKEKGTVVAYFEGGKEYIRESISYRLFKITNCSYDLSKCTDAEFAGLDDDYFVGRAKVNFEAGDKFIVEVGKYLAHDRLLYKYRKLEKRIANRVAEMVKRDYDEMLKNLERI